MGIQSREHGLKGFQPIASQSGQSSNPGLFPKASRSEWQQHGDSDRAWPEDHRWAGSGLGGQESVLDRYRPKYHRSIEARWFLPQSAGQQQPGRASGHCCFPQEGVSFWPTEKRPREEGPGEGALGGCLSFNNITVSPAFSQPLGAIFPCLSDDVVSQVPLLDGLGPHCQDRAGEPGWL